MFLAANVVLHSAQLPMSGNALLVGTKFACVEAQQIAKLNRCSVVLNLWWQWEVKYLATVLLLLLNVTAFHLLI